MQINLKVKVCGMREEENIRQLCELPIHYIGFIFYPLSRRYVGDMSAQVIKNIPLHIKKVGVFVNATREEIIFRLNKYQLDLVQLHGNESADFCRMLKAEGIQVIKAFAANDLNPEHLRTYSNACDFYLIDTPTHMHGGSGRKFDWNILNSTEIPLPFFLSGGIGPDDIQEIHRCYRPTMHAIDVNSRFEIEPGLKDIALLKKFIEQL